MRGLHINFDLGKADPVRLPYFIESWGFRTGKISSKHKNSFVVTDSKHPVEDFIELLSNSGCINIEIQTKNYAHFIELSDNLPLRKYDINIVFVGKF